MCAKKGSLVEEIGTLLLRNFWIHLFAGFLYLVRILRTLLLWLLITDKAKTMWYKHVKEKLLRRSAHYHYLYCTYLLPHFVRRQMVSFSQRYKHAHTQSRWCSGTLARVILFNSYSLEMFIKLFNPIDFTGKFYKLIKSSLLHSI